MGNADIPSVSAGGSGAGGGGSGPGGSGPGGSGPGGSGPGGAGPGGSGPGGAGGPGPEGSQRGRPRSAEADRVILDAAGSLLAERGLSGMSIEEVAARAGVGKATIYRRWPSKGLLALDAFMLMFRSLQPPVDSGSLREDLRSALRAWVRAVTTTPSGRLLTSLIAEAQHDPELHAAWRDRVLEPLRAQHRVVLERAVERGELSPGVDQDVVLDLFFGAAQHRLLLGHLALTDTFIDSVVDILLTGIAALPGQGRYPVSLCSQRANALVHFMETDPSEAVSVTGRRGGGRTGRARAHARHCP